MKAEIIAVGTEILLGDIVNTNAQYLSKQLANIGVEVYNQSVVGDNNERVLKAFEEGFSRADLIITTGGLGPTQDDLTKEMAARYFNKELVVHEESLKYIEDYFKKNGRELKGGNRKQAYFPKGAYVLPNPNGTAPGAIIKENEKIMVILPGPPKEMKPMFENYVIPYLEKFTDNVLVSKVLRIFGIGEGYMAEKIGDIIKSKNPTVAPYAKDKDVILRITAKADSKEEANKLINPVEEQIRNILKDDIYGEGENTSLEEVVAKKLVEKNLTIATAESCTGGLLAATLINYPGISKVFLDGCVTYSNESKIKRLGVNEEILNKYGAVSEEVAKAMAEGIAKGLGTNIGVSTTGIAGPDGGTEKKPVGLVYAGLYINGEVKVKKFNFQGNRQKVRLRTVMNVLDWIRREI